MAYTGKGRGWNFRKGAKDVPSDEELRARASKGGSAKVPKGLSDPATMVKAMTARQIKQAENKKRKLGE